MVNLANLSYFQITRWDYKTSNGVNQLRFMREWSKFGVTGSFPVIPILPTWRECRDFLASFQSVHNNIKEIMFSVIYDHDSQLRGGLAHWIAQGASLVN